MHSRTLVCSDKEGYTICVDWWLSASFWYIEVSVDGGSAPSVSWLFQGLSTGNWCFRKRAGCCPGLETRWWVGEANYLCKLNPAGTWVQLRRDRDGGIGCCLGCLTVLPLPLWPQMHDIHGPWGTAISTGHSSSLREIGKVGFGLAGAGLTNSVPHGEA